VPGKDCTYRQGESVIQHRNSLSCCFRFEIEKNKDRQKAFKGVAITIRAIKNFKPVLKKHP